MIDFQKAWPRSCEASMWMTLSLRGPTVSKAKATFKRRISAVSNAIETIDNEANHLIIFCLNCIRHGRNATYEPGLMG